MSDAFINTLWGITWSTWCFDYIVTYLNVSYTYRVAHLATRLLRIFAQCVLKPVSVVTDRQTALDPRYHGVIMLITKNNMLKYTGMVVTFYV
jgi:hypothetical protein